MKRTIPPLVAAATLAGLCWAFPPFHIRSLKDVREAQAAGVFDAAAFVEKFWEEQLLPAAGGAADVTAVAQLIGTSPQSVREQFGRTVGVSTSYFLFVRGSARVVSVDADQVGLSLKAEGEETDIVVPLGLVFGNALRDATGLLEPSSYPNAQEFNDISAALNSIVETDVLPRLQQIARVGDRLHFVGCAEVGDEDMDLKPLTLVPVSVEEAKH